MVTADAASRLCTVYVGLLRTLLLLVHQLFIGDSFAMLLLVARAPSSDSDGMLALRSMRWEAHSGLCGNWQGSSILCI